MACNNIGNKNSGVMGIRKESTYLTPVHTTFDAGELINPIFANSFESNVTPNKDVVKTLNGQRGYSASDATKGLNVRSLSIVGDMKQNGYGFICEAFNQVSEYSTDHMEFKEEDSSNNCMSGTYTIWLPSINNGVESGERLAGCIPLSLEENWVEGTYTATFVPSTKTALIASNTVPTYPTDYNVGALEFPNFKKSIGKLVFGSNVLQTSSLTSTITYTLNEDNAGFYDENGDRNGFSIGAQELVVSYTSPLSDSVTADNISKTLLDDIENSTERAFEIRIVEDSTHKIIKTFNGLVQGEATERGGSELYNFSAEIKPTLNSGTSILTSVYDGYGDITVEL